jgi:hypothetical protein
MSGATSFADRLVEVEARPLLQGQHLTRLERAQKAWCAMEAVAYLAGERWSDSPQCACPVIASFMRAWNDGLLTDEDRNRLLKPLVPLVVGTRADTATEERRAFMAMDWLIRVHTPAWLDRVEALKPHAQALRDLETIADAAGLVAATGRLRVAQKDAAAARAAASDAAWDAASDAAWDAARAAAMDAARAAASDAARAAARDAAWYAAWYAARAAARAAARGALRPTTEWLQSSAQQLVRDMCAVRA